MCFVVAIYPKIDEGRRPSLEKYSTIPQITYEGSSEVQVGKGTKI
jgi:hypothetical protein